jgi:hypothetical protein
MRFKNQWNQEGSLTYVTAHSFLCNKWLVTGRLEPADIHNLYKFDIHISLITPHSLAAAPQCLHHMIKFKGTSIL